MALKDFFKGLIHREDIAYDVTRNGDSDLVRQSDGTMANRKRINSDHIPVPKTVNPVPGSLSHLETVSDFLKLIVANYDSIQTLTERVDNCCTEGASNGGDTGGDNGGSGGNQTNPSAIVGNVTHLTILWTFSDVIHNTTGNNPYTGIWFFDFNYIQRTIPVAKIGAYYDLTLDDPIVVGTNLTRGDVFLYKLDGTLPRAVGLGVNDPIDTIRGANIPPTSHFDGKVVADITLPYVFEREPLGVTHYVVGVKSDVGDFGDNTERQEVKVRD